jgi:hypothetical protein
MPNEFIIKNGYRSQGNSEITGSLTVVLDNARELQVTAAGVNIGNIITDTHRVTGSFNISGSAAIVGNTQITGSLNISSSNLNTVIVGNPSGPGVELSPLNQSYKFKVGNGNWGFFITGSSGGTLISGGAYDLDLRSNLNVENNVSFITRNSTFRHQLFASTWNITDFITGAQRLSINQGGNVLIGTGSINTGVLLDVRAQGALSTDIAFRVRNSANTTNLMDIRGNGNVGIGTTSDAGFRLDVSGSARIGGSQVRAEFDTTIGDYKFRGGNGNLGIDLGHYSINSGGFISSPFNGINILSRLWIENGVEARFITRNTPFNWDIFGNSSWNVRQLTGEVTLFRINPNGNVLIGTTTDSGFKLDVSGSTRINGNTTITGSFTVMTGSARELQVTAAGVNIGNIITDTHTVTGSFNVSGSVTATNFTGSLFGTSSWANNAISSSYALTASYAYYSTSASHAEFSTSASHAVTASYAETSQLTNNAYFAQGILGADQSIPSGTDEIIQFIDQYDPQGWWDGGTYKFTPTVAGYYIVSLGVWFENPNNNTVQLNVQMRVNGNQEMICQQPATTVSGVSLFGTKIVYLNGSTDYVDFTAYQGTGGSINILQGNSAGSGTWFSATYMTM